ncbi:MAG: hypothetical protein IJ809_06655 [Clostridia bacterium]|nr:hypothetical protein [Clostridia bacterium]
MKEELVRLSFVEFKQVNNANVVFFEFNVVGNRRRRYVAEVFNADITILKALSQIANIPFYGVPFKFYSAENKSYIFIALFSEIKDEIIAFAPCNGKIGKITWIYIKETYLSHKYVSNEIYNKYLSYKEITIMQTYNDMNYGKIHEYLYSKIDNFDELNTEEKLMLFIAEVFENSNIMNGCIYSSMIELTSKYLKIRKIKFPKSALKQAFDIVEYGNYCKLSSPEIDVFDSIS